MNFRGLFRGAGVCAVGFAVISLLGYGIWVATNGLTALSTTSPGPDRILQMAQARWNQVSSFLDLLSYLFWIPALVGIFAFLRERTPGRAHVAGAFMAFSLIGLFTSSVLNAAMISLARGTVTESLKDRLVTLDQVSFSMAMPALLALAAGNVLWGLAFRSQPGLGKALGNLFLTQAVLFVLTLISMMAHQSLLFNAGVLVTNLVMIATYALAGVFLYRAWQMAPETTSSVQEKGRAAGASG
jgi:hypothetical protein